MNLTLTIQVKQVQAFDGNPLEVLSVSAPELDYTAEAVIDPMVPTDVQKRFATQSAFQAIARMVERHWDKTGLL
jgi:hypothetical protein